MERFCLVFGSTWSVFFVVLRVLVLFLDETGAAQVRINGVTNNEDYLLRLQRQDGSVYARNNRKDYFENRYRRDSNVKQYQTQQNILPLGHHSSSAVKQELRHKVKREITPSDKAHGTVHSYYNSQSRPHVIFEFPDYQAQCDEDVPLKTELINAKLRNLPDNPHLEIIISNGNFTATRNGDIVTIMNNNTLDYDDNAGSYEFLINVKIVPSGETAAATIRIKTRNKNDEAPRFTQTIYRTSIDERAQDKALVATVIATDKDGDRVTYSFADGKLLYKYFKIDENTGVIRLQGKPDFKEDNYEINVTATDDGSCCKDGEQTIHSSSAVVVVSIIDVNDHKPVFQNCESLNASIEENKPPETFLITIKATDEDRGLNGQVEYQIVKKPGHQEDNFNIDRKTGVITSKRSFDREGDDGKFLSLTVKATDKGNPPLEGLCTFVVQIIDVNDNSPAFDRKEYVENVPAKKAPGDRLFRVSATDLDAGQNAIIEYYLDPEQEIFEINRDSGIISLKKSLSRREYTFHVIARDKGEKPNESKVRVVIEIRTEDPNIVPPVWEGEPYGPVHLLENSSTNTDVITVKATANNEKVMYRLVDGNTIQTNKRNTFILLPEKINGQDVGKIKVNAQLDFETVSDYNLTVRAELSGSIPLASETSINIKLIDVNDETPLFNFDEQGSVLENEPIGTDVFKITAQDRDGTFPFNQVFYRIKEGNEYFSIDKDHGTVKTMKTFDRENQTSYRILVEVKDGAPSARPNNLDNQPNINAQIFRITIGDKNDNPPKFAERLYTASVKENEDIRHIVISITATDEDESSQIVYQLTTGNDGGAFGVGDATGEIYVAGSLDYETKKSYNLVLVATDGIHEADTNVVINIEDVNDLPPKFSQLKYEVYLTEEDDQGLPKRILQVSAVDGDKDRPQEIVYFLSGQGTEAPEIFFSVDNRTGEIFVLGPLDRDLPNGRPEWRFTVLASDEGGRKGSLSGYAEVIVYLKDINDNQPLFPNEKYEGYVTENLTSKGELALTMKAEDYDDPLVEGNAVLKYDIVSNVQKDGADIFSINADDATIRTAVCCLDREEIDKYIIVVRATDGGGLSGTGTATIYVKDVNDNPPRFEYPVYELKVEETYGDQIPSEPILTVLVLDDDLPETNQNYFRIVDSSGPGFDRFSIYANIKKDEGLLKIYQTLDYEDKIQRNGFHFKIMVDDNNGLSNDSNHQAFAEIKITLIDINDNAPDFEESLKTENISEYAEQGTKITTFIATDKDEDGKQVVRYAIDRLTNRRRHFSITSQGVVSILRKLDREEQDRHVVRILAIDEGRPPRTSTATLIVNVIDENDNAPTFLEEYEGHVKENSDPGSVLDKFKNPLVIEAYDRDSYEAHNGPPFTFSMDSSAPFDVTENFKVEFFKDGGPKREGIAMVNSLNRMDREQQKEYHIPIKITDAGALPQSGTSTLTVVIDDVNDNTMTDGDTNILVYNFKGKFPKMVIGRVYANDMDDDDWPDKTYTWIKKHGQFILNETSGELTMLNGTREGTYGLEVKIYDNVRRETATSVVTVKVENIPEEAIYKSGSIRIKDMSEEEFVRVWDYKNQKIVPSKRDLLRKKIAAIIKAKEENVQVFTILKSKHSNMLDVRFAAHGSPYYKPEKLNGEMSEKKGEIEDELGIKIAMIGIDECLYENVNCEGSCSNQLMIYEYPHTVISPRSSFVGIHSFVEAICKCVAREDFPRESCKRNPCYNGGTCEMEHNGVKCNCLKGFDGPRCQQTTRGFNGNGYAWFPPLQQCENSHLSLEFVTKSDGLLFYNGPITEPDPGSEIVQDFISLELLEGKPNLLLDFGSGTLELIVSQSKNLADGEWHRIDILWEPELISLTVDMCKDASHNSVNADEVDRSTCEARGEPVGLNEYLNVNGPLQLGGIRHAPLTNYDWNLQYTTKGFDGCIRNFIHNSEMYDLESPGIKSDSEPGCPHTEAMCKNNNIESSCINGICVASMNAFKCLCKPGFYGPACEHTTPPTMFDEGSFVQYHIHGDTRPEFVSELQIRYRASHPNGEIMYLEGKNKAFIVLELVNSTLQLRFNLHENHSEEQKVFLYYFHANDGYWHTVHVERYGSIAFLSVDGGGGKYYNETTDFRGLSQFFKVRKEGIVLGGHTNDYGIQINDYYRACIDDPRYPNVFSHLPLPPQDIDSDFAMVKNSSNLTPECHSSSCEGVNCPDLMECVPLFFDTDCRCIAGYELNEMNQCVDINECDDYPNPCLNEGICVNSQPFFTCECIPPYIGVYCEILQEKREVKLSMGALAAILICVLVILILVLVLIIYTKNRSTNYGPVDPDDDIRENIINYNDEGGGEDDMNTYDISPLRIPIDASGMPIGAKPGPEKPYNEVQNRGYSPDEPNVGEFINSNLGKADDDPEAMPLDDLRVYAYEGGGSDAGSLSSLASGTDDDEQDFDYLNGWGPRFQKLADMYGQGESEEE